MYKIIKKTDTVRVPPERLGEDLERVVRELTHINYEGKMDRNHNLTVLTTNIDLVGSGRIVHGDGGVYQNVQYDALVFKPELQEVISGTVCEVLKFGAFVRFGPLDGLLHISQIMDDHIDIDLANERLIGRESKHDLKIGDRVRARVVSISFNERNPRESKIGLTMRQPGLGKNEWLVEDRRKESSEKGAGPSQGPPVPDTVKKRKKRK